MTPVITSQKQIDLEKFYAMALDPIGVSKTAIVEDFTLVTGAKLDRSLNSIQFNLLERQTNTDERKNKGFRLLAADDIAYISDISIFLKKVNQATGEYSVIPLTYPESTVFVGVKGGKKETDSLQALYEGTLNFVRNRTTLLKDFSMRKFLYAPMRQLKDNVYPNINSDAAVEMSVKSVITGADDIEFNIMLAKATAEMRELLEGGIAADGSDIAGVSNYVYIHLEGFRASKVADKFKKYREENNKRLGITD